MFKKNKTHKQNEKIKKILINKILKNDNIIENVKKINKTSELFLKISIFSNILCFILSIFFFYNKFSLQFFTPLHMIEIFLAFCGSSFLTSSIIFNINILANLKKLEKIKKEKLNFNHEEILEISKLTTPEELENLLKYTEKQSTISILDNINYQETEIDDKVKIKNKARKQLVNSFYEKKDEK